MKNCGKCHTCGTPLQIKWNSGVYNGWEYCSKCDDYKCYRSHGWGGNYLDDTRSECPENSKNNGAIGGGG